MILLVVDSGNIITPHQRLSLNQSGWQLCDVTPIEPTVMTLDGSSKNRYTFEKMFSKLHIWNLVEYDSILYIDADVIAVSSPHRVFTEFTPEMGANGLELGMVQLGYRWNDFNAGVMLVIPGFTSVKQLCRATNTTAFSTSLAEQNFLNAFFKHRIYQLPHSYNLNNRNPTILANDITHLLLAPAQPVLIHMLDKPWAYSLDNWAEGIRQYWLNAPPAVMC
jgi:lipopolysaccharide biosynthesis glycosyltransferase